jgi:hypothetical protein
MRSTWVCGAVLLFGVLCLAVTAPVNFSGTWVLDPAKSELGGPPRGGGFPGGGRGGGGFPRGEDGGFPRGEGGGFPGGEGGGFPGGARRGAPGQEGERGPRGPRVATTLVIEQNETELKVTRKSSTGDEEQDRTQVYSLTGETKSNPAPMGRGEMKTRSVWNKEKLVNTGTQTIQTPGGEREITLKEEYSLSKDGRELTVKNTRNTPMGEMTSKLVYKKQ